MTHSSVPSSQPTAVTRRGFLRRLGIVPALLPGMVGRSANGSPSGRVRFGVISDIHPDMLPDGLDRVRAFVAAMEAARVDFIVQLGDFCWPAPSNRPYLEAWNEYRGPAYHVLGNHDMDDGYTREQTVALCERGELVIEGKRTKWVGPDPWTRGETTDRPHEYLHPWISDRRLKLG